MDRQRLFRAGQDESMSDATDGGERLDATNPVDVSLVIPTFREFALEDSIRNLLGHLTAFPLGVTEILVVDDSDDEAQAAAAAVLEKNAPGLVDCDLRLIPGPRRGKGAAVREGVLAARGKVIFVMDADLPVALRYLNEFAAVLRSGTVDGVVAERPNDRNRDNFVRNVLSRGLYWVQRGLVFRAHCFDDTQCGFKAFRAELLQRIARQQVIEGGMVDLEYLYVARFLGANVVRVPVDVNLEIRPSRINVWRCLRVDPVDIGRLVIRGLTGHYR
jgi:dolichyl-phosphate beta-glucosyltransferase